MKKIFKLVVIILLIFVGINTYAITPTTCDRNTKPNYGVNKDFKITSRNKSNVLNARCVDASEKLYDFSGVLTDEEYKTLQEKLLDFSKEYKTDLVIVIDDFAYIYDSKNETYAADFYDYNDFGIEYEKYSGILFLRNTYEEDPYYDIYAFGNAQLYFNQGRTDLLLDEVYDDIHNGRYMDGFDLLIRRLKTFYDTGPINDFVVTNKGKVKQKFIYPLGICLGIPAIVVLVSLIIMISKNKMVKKATSASEYMDKTNSKITIKNDKFVSTHTSVVHHSSSSSSGGGGHSGGGFHTGSSGGGHFSGGGRHG